MTIQCYSTFFISNFFCWSYSNWRPIFLKRINIYVLLRPEKSSTFISLIIQSLEKGVPITNSPVGNVMDLLVQKKITFTYYIFLLSKQKFFYNEIKKNKDANSQHFLPIRLNEIAGGELFRNNTYNSESNATHKALLAIAQQSTLEEISCHL